MALTALQVRQAVPREKPYKLFDGGGLFLLVKPNGSKLWRFRFDYNKKAKEISFGAYPEVTLAKAREARAAARQELITGINPSESRKARRASSQSGKTTLEMIGREWLAMKQPNLAESYYSKVMRRLERIIFPALGELPIGVIGALDLLVPLKRIADEGHRETAHRTKQICSQVFRYAVATGRADRDITADLKGALPPPIRRHHPTITDPEGIGALLRAIDGYDCYPIVRFALQLAPLVFVRPGELRGAEWSEINLERAEWRIRAERMKMRSEHIVPLSTQAIAILRELRTHTNNSRYLFPSIRTLEKSISENTLNAALRRLGYTSDEMTAHGFRSMASTLLNEAGWNRDAIERQLAHAERDSIRAAYNYAEHLPIRREMMQSWADYLDDLKTNNRRAGQCVVAIR